MQLEGPPKMPMSLGMKLVLFGAIGLVVVVVAVFLVGKYGFGWFGGSPFPNPSGRFKPERITIYGNVDYTTIVERAKDTPGDGADDLLALIQRYDRTRAEIADKRRAGGSEPPLTRHLTALSDDEDNLDPGTSLPFTCAAELMAAGDKKDFTSSKLLQLKDLEWRDPPEMDAIEGISLAIVLEAVIAQKRQDNAKAESMYRAMLLVGRRLAESQERVWVQMKGWDMQKEAARRLGMLWEKGGPAEKFEAAKTYANAAYKTFMQANNQNFGPLCRMLNKWDVGDLGLFARKHPDRAWRVEALLSLGMARLNKSGAMHNKVVLKYLDEQAKSSDPWIAAAAKWSRDLELPVYRTQVSERAR